MKTGKKIALLIGILMLALGITAVKIAHHRGESFAAGIRGGSIGISSELAYDQKGYSVSSGEERFSADDVRALRIDWLSGSVSVERYDGRDVVVREKAAVELSEDQSMRWKLSGGTLSILPCANTVRRLPEKDLTVLVPQSLTLEEAEVDTTSASVSLLGLEISGALDADSISGSLRAEDCRCALLDFDSSSGSQKIFRTDVSGEVEADTISGSFTAEDLRCAALSVDSTSGSQTIASLSCDALTLSSSSGSQRGSALDCRSAQADAGSGSIRLDFDAVPQTVNVETMSGSVELSFPQGTEIDLQYDSSSGSLHGDFIRARGGLPVDVSTASGSLTIRYR